MYGHDDGGLSTRHGPFASFRQGDRDVPRRHRSVVRKSIKLDEARILQNRAFKEGQQMKVVLFCGGAGMRLRGYSEDVPKPMVTIGSRPVLWHVMKYYAHFGHKDFILCLGYKANVIKNYFLEYEESVSNDFVLSKGGRDLEFMQRDIDDWRITFVDTGQRSTIGDRLRLIEPYLKGEDVFLANYSDGLTDFPLPTLIDEFSHRDGYATV